MERYAKLRRIMMGFYMGQLRNYVGADIVEQMAVEWEMSESALVTKKLLAQMALQLNGISLLGRADFRKDVLMHLKSEEIDRIFEELPARKKAGITDLAQKAQTVAAMPWRDSPANRELLTILEIDDPVFSINNVDDTVIANHQSANRFFELLDYQYYIRQRLLNELNRPDAQLKRMLVHMPTGTGKTKTTMHTVVNHYIFSKNKKGLVIWLAHTTELLQQAYHTFCDVWEHLGSGAIRSYRVWGNRNLSSDSTELDGFVFCGIQKLQNIQKSRPDLFEVIKRNACLIVFDEAHKALASETRELIESLMVLEPGTCDRSLIGLTATPGRTTMATSENSALSDMFNRTRISINLAAVAKINLSPVDYLNRTDQDNIIQYFQSARILSRIRKEELSYSEDLSTSELEAIRVVMTENGYEDFSRKSLEKIGQNRKRNAAILCRLRELYAEHIPTIVFACSVAHAKLLSYMLSLENIQNSLVLGGMAPWDREDAIAAFKDEENPVNILINYEVLTTGFDATNIGCVFITRPTQSIVLYSQMLGRGLRGPLMGGGEECLLIDLKDNLGKYNPNLAFAHFNDYWN